MKYRVPTLFLTAALVGASLAPARAADLHSVLTGYTLTSWSQKDGLPAGTIFALAQDAEGYLWVGTERGPYRFDGVRFVAWSALSPSPLPQTSVRAIRASRDGSVWVGFGESGGIGRLHQGIARRFGEHEGLPASPVTTLLEDAAGILWAGTGAGLFRLSGERWERWGPDRGFPDGPVSAGYVSSGRHLLFGTAAGLHRFNESTQRFATLALLKDVPRAIAEDASGAISVTDQIVGFRRTDEEPAPESARERGRGRQLLRDRRQNLWVGTAGQGLWRVRLDERGRVIFTERATALTGLLADGVVGLAEDREGNIWVGTTEGVNRLTPHKVTQVTDIGLVAGVEVASDGALWVGTVDELIQFSGSSTGTPTERRPLGRSRLRSLHADRRGDLWVATSAGLSRFLDGRLVPVPVQRAADMPRQIDTITSDARQGAWVFDAALGLLHWRDGQFLTVPLPSSVADSRVIATYTDSTGRAWFAFSNGQVAASDERGGVTVYGAAEGADGGVYQAIYEDRQHVIWLGGTMGLTRFGDGRFVTIHGGNGFPVSNLTAIVEDDADYLWIGSGVGIIQIRREECERAVADPGYQADYKLYDRSDGLAGLPFVYSANRRAVRGADGRLWFVTGRGLTVLDPRDLRSRDTPSRVRIEGAVADDIRLRADPGLRLPARSTRLEIEYTALNLTSPLKQHFRYQLEGFDAGWIEAGTRRQAFYTNLPPRRYRFRVMSGDGDGTWTPSGAVWEFSIRPMFYQTAWFMVVCAAATVLAIGGAWRLHVRQVRRQFALLIGERARLSREIHDTLLQSLVGVALQFDAMANDSDGTSDSRKERFVRMRKQVEEYIREARQSIWDLRSPTLMGQDLIAALREAGERATNGNGVGFALDVRGTPRRYPARTEEQILRIGQEAIVNAIRHAHAGQVSVELDFADASLKLRVSDDGTGFDPGAIASNGNGHYGLTSMRERAEDVGGTLTVRSAVGRGTHVEASVPTAPHA